jgi:hypothetical protein
VGTGCCGLYCFFFFFLLLLEESVADVPVVFCDPLAAESSALMPV